MAEAVVAPLVGKLQEMALNEAKAMVAVNGDIRRLRDRLMWMQAFLQHTDPRCRDVSNELVGVWRTQTRDAAFDAEDALDHYSRRIDVSRYPTWTQSIIRFLAGLTTQLSVRHDLSRRIAEINSRLEDIIINKEKYKVEIESDKSAVLWKTSKNISTIATSLEIVRPNLIPRGKLVENLENHRSVIYVTGKSGVGKTTLVRDIYESENTKTFFGVRVWLQFPAFMDFNTILQLINQQLDDGLKRKKETQQLDGSDIQLPGTRGNFLVVIDGQLRDSDWNTILSTLSPDENSRVIRIVHSTDKPRNAADGKIIEVGPLEIDATIELFHKMVQNKRFTPDQPSQLPASQPAIPSSHNASASAPATSQPNKAIDLTAAPTPATSQANEANDETTERGGSKEQNDTKKCIYDDMWTITGGRPLAVMLLSGLLKTREYPNEWQAVFKHLKSKQSKRLGSLLATCFDDLPQELKSCFLYFAAFPVNTPIEAHKLVRLWMAEGFLKPRDGNTMENVGRIYLNELNSRHLVQLEKYDISGDEVLVSVHHRVHQFVQLEAHEANFVDIHSGYDMPYSASARRLSLQNYTNKYAALANSMPKLRSVLSNFIQENEKDTGASEQEMKQQMKDTDKSVQTKHSDLDGSGEEQSKKPWIGLLSCWGKKKRQEYIKLNGMLQLSKFLRVVKLQGFEFGKNLPATIGNAVHLQYLGVNGCSLECIPSAVGKLKHLQTLDVQDTKVRKLPQAFWEIGTLRHVLGTDISLPKRVGKLKHLQTLVKVLTNRNSWDAETFAKMLRLQSLHVVEGSSKNDKSLKKLFDAIAEPNILEYLQTLVLQATRNDLPMCIFTSSSQRRLRTLELCGKLEWGKTEGEIDICLPNLTTLSLEGTLVTQAFMNYLAKFPLLANLTLKQGSYQDATLVFNSGGYKCLTKMTLCYLGNLQAVQIMKSGLPVLTDLVILRSTKTQVKLIVYRKHEYLETLQYENKELRDEAP